MTIVFAGALYSGISVYGAFTTVHYFSDTYSAASDGPFSGPVICGVALIGVIVAAWSSNRPLSNLKDIRETRSSTVFPAPTCTSPDANIAN